ncbi:MAG: hypothetical protein KBH15_04890 [Candidatus Atribacteria bacterium]|nr:hypothetical protein [Candidatus Atribacteria bacterium]
MDEKRALKIDLEDLCLAMENSSYDLDYYLDLETGEVIFISDYMDDANLEELKDRIDENPDRYEPIPKAESSEDYDDMVDFISTVEDEHLVELLEVAIDGKGAFRRFKDVLARYPEEKERWYRFKNERMKERAISWLEAIGISLQGE